MTEIRESLNNLKSLSPASQEQVRHIEQSCRALNITSQQVRDVSAKVLTIAGIWSTVGATQIDVLEHVVMLPSVAD